MSWSRPLTLTLDVDAPSNRVLITSLQDINFPQAPTIYAGDHFPLRIQLAQRSQVSLAQPVTLPQDSTFVLAAKSSHTDSNLLWLALPETWAPVVDEQNAPIPGLYQADLDLNTDAAIEHSLSGPKTILVELEVRDEANTRRRSLQWEMVLRPQVYSGEAPPTGGGSPDEPTDPDSFAITPFSAHSIEDSGTAFPVVSLLADVLPAVPPPFYRHILLLNGQSLTSPRQINWADIVIPLGAQPIWTTLAPATSALISVGIVPDGEWMLLSAVPAYPNSPTP